MGTLPASSMCATTHLPFNADPQSQTHTHLNSRHVRPFSHAQVSNRRPAFPAYVPPAMTALARKCWATNPSDRPTFAHVVSEIDALVADLDGLQAHADLHPGLDLTSVLPEADEPATYTRSGPGGAML